MINYKQFINWQFIHEAGKPKPRKVPCDTNRRYINHLDPAQWLTYDQAFANAQGNPHLRIGFVFTANDPYFFFDLDDCRGPDGQWNKEAHDFMNIFAGYAAEVSVSGNGIHIVGTCQKFLLADRKHKFGTLARPELWLEFYTVDRFMALGQGFQGDMNRDGTMLLSTIVPKELPNVSDIMSNGPVDEYTGPADDDKLIDMMLRSGGSAATAFGARASVADLWHAKAEILAQHFPSSSGDVYDRSSADQSLLTHLAFWTGKDAARMDRLFRRSGLMRPKYEDRAQYRQDTINRGISSAKGVYNIARPTPAISEGGPLLGFEQTVFTNSYLTRTDQTKLFDGCTYLLKPHRVLVPGGDMLKPEQFNVKYGGYLFNMDIEGKTSTKLAFEAFTQNRISPFPKAQNTCFKPMLPFGALVGDMVNSYTPVITPSKAGDPSRLIELLEKQLPNERDRRIFMSNIAAMVQYPGIKFQWACVLQGVEGNGKSAWARIVYKAIGDRYSHTPAAGDMENPFNSFLQDKLFIAVEEIHMNGRRQLLDTLKPLITNDRVEIQPKGVDKYMIDNYANWLFSTNHKDAILKTQNDRRYAVFFTAQQDVADLERDGMNGDYFPDLYEWLDREGYLIATDWLRNYQIDDEFNPAKRCHRAPATSTQGQAIEASLGRIEQEIIEMSEQGIAGFRNGWLSAEAVKRVSKELRVNLTTSSLNTMLESLGYRRFERASRVISEENNAKPILYVKKELWNVWLTTEHYCQAQGYMFK